MTNVEDILPSLYRKSSVVEWAARGSPGRHPDVVIVGRVHDYGLPDQRFREHRRSIAHFLHSPMSVIINGCLERWYAWSVGRGRALYEDGGADTIDSTHLLQ
jgi:hypothetical protein